MNELDPIQQRILGVLIEKEITVPDTYPLSENALLAGCNQKNNRDPEMALSPDDVRPALQVLMEVGWVTRIDTYGGRGVVRWRHQFESQLGLETPQTAVLAELLLRGPQAPGALKTRVARLGLAATPEEILDVLQRLAQRDPPLVGQQPRRPRERDQRWGHILGPQPAHEGAAVAGDAAATRAPSSPGLAERVVALESEVAELRAELRKLRGDVAHD